ncbi:MAG: FMN-binding protein [Dehalococcoidia bacterium]|nr:FMN-binding protein [Dehalococcoidia bacterium]
MRILKKVYPIISITIVVFIAVALLNSTYIVAAPAIERQRELRMERMLKEIFPDMTDRTDVNGIYRIYANGDEIGTAFLAVGTGWGGAINILVGIENETIKGIAILSHSETPGLGARITEDEFRDQFAGLHIDDVALRRDNGKIDAITAATISSRTVADAVRAAAMDIIESLRGRE